MNGIAPSPFLSILIPLYNWDIGELLQKIHDQAMALREKSEIEILVFDDGSTKLFGAEAKAQQLSLVRYQALTRNSGRAAIRNRLLEHARGEYVLYLDADMLPDNDTFLQHYIEYAEKGCDIICGGISYAQNIEKGNESSFYLYKSLKTEALSAKQRSRTPWRYLFTSNILLRRKIAESVRFDPRFTGYGFEDIEWALRLADSYSLTHIDNTCSHMGLMTKRQAFARMRDSTENYALLLALHTAKTASSSGAKISGILMKLPCSILRGIDTLLARLFSLPWNPLSLVLFQCDKMVLLALQRKNRNLSIFQDP